jgi:hypothetical protein
LQLDFVAAIVIDTGLNSATICQIVVSHLPSPEGRRVIVSDNYSVGGIWNRDQLPKQLGEQLWVVANLKRPLAELTPIVHGADPAGGGLMLGFVLVVFVPLDLKQEHDAVGKSDEVVGLVEVAHAVVLIREGQAEFFVSGIEVDGIFRLLQPEGRRFLSRLVISDNLVDVAPLGRMARLDRLEVNISRRSNSLVAIENRQEWWLAL